MRLCARSPGWHWTYEKTKKVTIATRTSVRAYDEPRINNEKRAMSGIQFLSVSQLQRRVGPFLSSSVRRSQRRAEWDHAPVLAGEKQASKKKKKRKRPPCKKNCCCKTKVALLHKSCFAARTTEKKKKKKRHCCCCSNYTTIVKNEQSRVSSSAQVKKGTSFASMRRAMIHNSKSAPS